MTFLTNIKMIIREYYEQHCADKFKYLDEMNIERKKD